MTEELEDLRRRADQGGEPASDASRNAEPAQDPRFGQVESMMRSVLLHQNDHTSDLRKAIGYLQILVERKINDRRP